jgi:hypothetical protein
LYCVIKIQFGMMILNINTNVMLKSVYFLRYSWHKRRFGICLYCHLQVIGCHCTDKYFTIRPIKEDPISISAVAIDLKKTGSIMTTNYMKTGVEPTPETSCILDIPQTNNSVQHNIPLLNQTMLIFSLLFL